MSSTPDLRRPAGNLSTGALKLIALFFMLVDHAGKVLMNNPYEWRLLGRIAFPIYVWCMVVGFCRTRNVPKYVLRVLITGIVSQPLYIMALNHSWPVYSTPNIFFTLVLGLLALWGIREKKAGSHLWAPVAAILLAEAFKVDYGWRGILLMILLYAVRDSRAGIAAVMVPLFLFWGASYRVPASLFGIPVNLNSLPAFVSTPLSAFLRLETFALLSLPFLLIRFSRDVRLPRWIWYAIYPAHLLLLILLKALILGQAPEFPASFAAFFR